MKKCPYCAEEIQNDAIFCRYCKRDVDLSKIPETTKNEFQSIQKSETTGTKSSNKTLIIILIIVVVIIAIVLIKQQYDIQMEDVFNKINQSLSGV